MNLGDHYNTVKWIAKVINSCETEEQRKNAGRLARVWINRYKESISFSNKNAWLNFMSLADYLGDVNLAKKKELRGETS